MDIRGRTILRHSAWTLLSALALAACGPGRVATSETGGADFNTGMAQNALSSDNGLSRNGLSRNGLSRNGLSRNGLSRNGLGTADFATWFAEDPTTSDAVMSYVYRCAAPAGSALIWTDPTTSVSYTWQGVLGLAPGWTAGAPATDAEQQVVSACLAAHVNKYGVHVPIAVEGRTASGMRIPIGPDELATYSVKEGCFFGNVFNGDGIFVGLDHASWDSKTSSARACALDHQSVGVSIDCPPLYYVDYCAKLCKADATKTFYESCTFNGKTYQPLTTRLMPSEIFKCGDGVCQLTESCGSGADWNNCKSDCGLCP